jgi:hypothetical protein
MIVFLHGKGGIGMEDFKAANEQLDAAMEHEKPLRRKEGRVYSRTAREFFGKIKAFRGKGFSFVQICGAFEKAEVLPRGSNPYSFRQAFLRELSKRARAGELLEEIKGRCEAEASLPTEANVPVPARTGDSVEPGDGAAGKKESGEERIRRLTGNVVDTGLGNIVKHSDGSFEYN